MANELSFDLELQSLRERSVDRLLKADVFDREAFDTLLLYLDGKAHLFRAECAIPKQVLSCLREAASVILSRAEYVPAAKTNIDVAGEFEMLLDLMIIGETLADRATGVPRTV